jgi:hypothetical protein
MHWFISTLIICLAFFAAAHLVSEKIIGRMNRSKARWRELGLSHQRKQQLDDEMAHWERKEG